MTSVCVDVKSDRKEEIMSIEKVLDVKSYAEDDARNIGIKIKMTNTNTLDNRKDARNEHS